MTDHLEAIFLRQHASQRERGYRFGDMTTAERAAYLTWNNQAAVAELVEALDEHSWKPWATGEAFLNRDALAGELVDVLCFLVNQFLAIGVGPAELDDLHAAKDAVSHARFISGAYRARNDPTKVTNVIHSGPEPDTISS